MTVSNVSSASSEKSLAARSFRVTWGAAAAHRPGTRRARRASGRRSPSPDSSGSRVPAARRGRRCRCRSPGPAPDEGSAANAACRRSSLRSPRREMPGGCSCWSSGGAGARSRRRFGPAAAGVHEVEDLAPAFDLRDVRRPRRWRQLGVVGHHEAGQLRRSSAPTTGTISASANPLDRSKSGGRAPRTASATSGSPLRRMMRACASPLSRLVSVTREARQAASTAGRSAERGLEVS